MSRTAVKKSLSSRRDDKGVVSAMIRLYPYSRGRDASFDLLLYQGKRPREENLSKQVIGWIEINRVKNQDIMSCQICEHCLESRSPYKKYNTLQYAHYRWTEYTGSTTSAQMIRTWLDSCLKDHASCITEWPLQTPTRLLDVGGSVLEGDTRLVAGLETQGQPYATLSYCWGTCKTTVLTRGTCDAFCKCIKFDSLPRTLQHAVTICRKLAIPYLWIDALCIIQGPDGDWDTEASLMGSVYAGSMLTIAAADAAESNDGFLRYRSPLRQQDCRLLRDATHTVFAEAPNCCCTLGPCPGSSRLDTRGWVLQERVLSPRTLYFGTNGVHWECRGGNLCDEQPSFRHEPSLGGHHARPNSTMKKLYRTLCDLTAAADDTKARGDLLSCWNRVMETYSKTKLSYQSDKLVAVAGIASILQDRLDFQASYGLWLPWLDVQLLWTRFTGYDPRDWRSFSRNDFAPTWSWASVSGARLLFRIYNKYWSCVVTFEKIPSPTAFSRADSLPPPGSFESIIRLKGMLKRFLVDTISWRQKEPTVFVYPASQANGYYGYLSIRPDVFFDHHSTPLYCLLISKAQYEDDNGHRCEDETGLVLTPVDWSRNRFRKIGDFCFENSVDSVEQSVFASTLPQSGIEIV